TPPTPTLFPYTTLFRSDVAASTLVVFVAWLVFANQKFGDIIADAAIDLAIRWAYHALGIEDVVDNSVPLETVIGGTCVSRQQDRSEEHTSELQSPYDLV